MVCRQAVDAHVHQRATAGEIASQAPLRWIADGSTEVRVDDLDVAEHLLSRQTHAFEVVGLELAAITHAEHSVGLPDRVDHLLATLDRDLQRFLAEHVFAGRGGRDRVFEVHGIRRHNVDDADVLVVGHPSHRLIVVDTRFGQAVFLLPLGGLGGRAGDDAGQAAVARLLQRRRNLIGRQAAEAAERDTELPFPGLAERHAAQQGSDRKGGGMGYESAALVVGHVNSSGGLPIVAPAEPGRRYRASAASIRAATASRNESSASPSTSGP